ncbi:uncharacterized protein PGTG_19908 [Puccinia graminis f. sp. tritici CRL 75-36-700-3]|uniref:Uncharacterized protein n=1 Tax=Puccinia graminis f. sp. tritici (strain CRL 75-36-700-3 / race SCCL) TaxID=418459 RepID=E3LBE4_PUCGT|nr:uncharacterized protein PGTG_19908 [Puccinia graminis f. sp. tritici CRL 75-36-700-3]EFP93869.1 hypothetical protein PGTG_19908 [Puccinia graminis f. sp. tritici CRL 75-36-700-3]
MRFWPEHKGLINLTTTPTHWQQHYLLIKHVQKSPNLQLQEENRLLRERLEQSEQTASAFQAEIGKLRKDVTRLSSLKPTNKKIDDQVKSVSKVQTQLATLDKKSESLANVLTSLQQQMSNQTVNLDTHQLTSQSAPPGFSTPHPSQFALLEFLHSQPANSATYPPATARLYVAKAASEAPPTHFHQQWPQVIRDLIAIFHAFAKVNLDRLDTTTLTNFVTRVTKIKSIVTLRKLPIQYLCAFLVGGVSGLLYAGTKQIPPECLVTLVAYLKWYATQPNPLLLEPRQHWPRCRQIILMELLEDAEDA